MTTRTRRFTQRIARSMLALATGMVAATAVADTIAVIGTGRVASALGPGFAEQGHTIIYGSRDPARAEVQALVEQTQGAASAAAPAEAAAQADMVVVAVPGGAAIDVVNSLGDLSGKIVLDPTNIVMGGDDGAPAHAVETSNAELIQAAAPGARVVKAFNTLNYMTMIDPSSSGGPVTIPIVGDDADAKSQVAALAEGMGLETIDLGPLRYADTLEEMLVIWVNARNLGTPFDYHLRRRPAQ